MSEIRDVFFDEYLKFFDENKKIIFISVDMGAQKMNEVKLNEKERFINIGVSESNAVTVSAGLSSVGFLPCVYGITPFLVSRSRAQLRHDISIGNRKIILIGSGLGLTYAEDGPSHHSLDDIGLITSLPGFVHCTPCNREISRQLLAEAVKDDYSYFFRLDKGATVDEKDFLDIENSILLRKNSSNNLIITSTPEIFNNLVKDKTKDVAYLYKINTDYLNKFDIYFEHYESIEVIDESADIGGLSQIVVKFYSGKIIERCLKKAFVQEKGSRSLLRNRYNLSKF